MNLILLLDEDFVSEHHVRLGGRRALHVLAVHRASIGDVLRVGQLNGRVGDGCITTLGADSIELDIDLNAEPPRPLPLTLLLALPRPKSLKKVLQAAAAFGVKSIVLMNTRRVEKSFWESPVLLEPGLREQLLLGLEQARDTVMPVVTQQRRFKPFVEDVVPGMLRGSRALVAHPTTAGSCPHQVHGAITLAVGPEGGFIPYEIELLQERGFEAVSLGPRPLRVEHALPALIGRLF